MDKRRSLNLTILNASVIMILFILVYVIYVSVDASFDISVFGRGEYLKYSDTSGCISFFKSQYYKLTLAVCIAALILLLVNYIYFAATDKKIKVPMSFDKKASMIIIAVIIIMFVINAAVVSAFCLTYLHQIGEYAQREFTSRERIYSDVREYYHNLLWLVPIFLAELVAEITVVVKKKMKSTAALVFYIAYVPFFSALFLLHPFF